METRRAGGESGRSEVVVYGERNQVKIGHRAKYYRWPKTSLEIGPAVEAECVRVESAGSRRMRTSGDKPAPHFTSASSVVGTISASIGRWSEPTSRPSQPRRGLMPKPVNM